MLFKYGNDMGLAIYVAYELGEQRKERQKREVKLIGLTDRLSHREERNLERDQTEYWPIQKTYQL